MTDDTFDPWHLTSCELWRLERVEGQARLTLLCTHLTDGSDRPVLATLSGVTHFAPPSPSGSLCEVRATDGSWRELGDDFECEFDRVSVGESVDAAAGERASLTDAALLSDRAAPASSISGRGTVERVIGWNHPELALVERLGPCAVEVRVRGERGDAHLLVFGGAGEFALPKLSGEVVTWECRSASDRGWSSIDGTFVVDGRAWFHYASRRVTAPDRGSSR